MKIFLLKKVKTDSIGEELLHEPHSWGKADLLHVCVREWERYSKKSKDSCVYIPAVPDWCKRVKSELGPKSVSGFFFKCSFFFFFICVSEQGFILFPTISCTKQISLPFANLKCGSPAQNLRSRPSRLLGTEKISNRVVVQIVSKKTRHKQRCVCVCEISMKMPLLSMFLPSELCTPVLVTLDLYSY